MRLNFSLASDGPATQLFVAGGAQTFADALRIIAHLPYGRNALRNDIGCVFREGRGTCSTKHALLKTLTEEQGAQDVRLMLGIYRMNELNTLGVGPVLDAAGLNFLPEAHTYLRVSGAVVDCTTERSGRAKFTAGLMSEEEISPAQIGEWKVAHHRAFLQEWMAANFSGSLDELWAVREACIAALAAQQ